MIRLRHKVLIQATRLLDQAMLAATAVAVIYYRPDLALAEIPRPLVDPHDLSDLAGMLLLALGWIGIFDYYIRYRADRFVGLRMQIKDFIKAATISAGLLLAVSVIFSVKSVGSVGVMIFWCVVVFGGILSRILLRMVLVSARRSGYNYRYLLVVGANARAAELAKSIEQSTELGYKVVGFVAECEDSKRDWEERGEAGRILGTVSQLRAVLERERVDEMMVCLSVEFRFSMITAVLKEAKDLGIVLRIVPHPDEGVLLRKVRLEEFHDEFVITLFREHLLLQLLLKRAADVTISVVALIMLCPLMAVLALVIKFTSPGPVFFKQERVGMNQRKFRLYKFRSMVRDAEALKAELRHLNEVDGPAFKMESDPRVTKIGRFLRKTSLDELPQLFNVLRGEMSLVGPRPPLPDEVKQYEWLFRRRLSVKPGITCVWQVNGRSKTTFEQWMKMDQEYIENWSLWLDLKILVMTIPAVLFGRGAH